MRIKVTGRMKVRGRLHDVDVVGIILSDREGYRLRCLAIIDKKIYNFVTSIRCDNCILHNSDCDKLCSYKEIIEYFKLSRPAMVVRRLDKKDRKELLSSMFVVRWLYGISISNFGVYELSKG